ncbi:hypothetical protein ACFXDH_26040 [Streptomyces sp. NPDC059467]|uniref:hypothetical protein n=1 Tax=Streptomyces sp. NPDC059467 TaxID=3346844 RepID=UPI0036C0F311
MKHRKACSVTTADERQSDGDLPPSARLLAALAPLVCGGDPSARVAGGARTRTAGTSRAGVLRYRTATVGGNAEVPREGER